MNDVTADNIVDDILAMGVRAGDLLLVHSSLRSIGRVSGGAQTVAEALVEAVRSEGAVFVPAFTYADQPWHPQKAPSVVGAISEAFRKLPAAVRSNHCTHSVAGAGARAMEILADHEKVHPFAVESPLGRLWKLNAWVLLIGCDHRASSMVHVGEEAAGAPYLNRMRTQTILEGERSHEVRVRRPGPSHGFQIIDAPLRAGGKIIDGTVGQARCMLMRAGDIVETVCQMLGRDPMALLCKDPACERCGELRRMR